MGFKQFIIEMPHFVHAIKLKCPKGDTIDGKDIDTYSFDFATEFYDKELYPLKLSYMKFFSPISFQKPEGILPMYCKNHDIIFMYDFDNNKAIKADNEAKKILKKVSDAMKKRQKRDNEIVGNYTIW